MRALLVSFVVVLAGRVPAQGLQLPTAIVDPVQNYVFNTWLTPAVYPIAVGPVTWPLTMGIGWYGPSGRLDRNGDSLSMQWHALQYSSSLGRGAGLECSVVTRVVTPLPARVPVELVALATQSSSPLGNFTCSLMASVDIDANGTMEYTSGYPAAPAAVHSVLADARGTPLRWMTDMSVIVSMSGSASMDSTLELRFTAPVQEPAYGPACEGELGCQRVPNAPFDRVFVASLPGDTTYAWLLGGDQQVNVQFPGYACPLLVDPAVIVAVPLVPGANGRQFVDFEATLPPVPGLVWYAQGIAVSGGTFVGTNGVRIQT